MNEGVLQRPAGARWLLLFAHGAGAGMRHAFMDAVAGRFVDERVAVFRYEFEYMSQGRRRPDRQPVLLEAVRAAAEAQGAGDLPLIAGGKSMGGRMTSIAAAQGLLPNVRGLVFFSFPLHGAGKPPSTERAAHLADVPVPMLFLQGTRDKLADLDLIRGVCGGLPRATLHVVEGADHGSHVLKRSGRTDEQVLDELVAATIAWAEPILP